MCAHSTHLASIIVTRFILSVCWKRTLWEGEDHSWIRVVCTATTGFDVRNATHYLRLAIRTGIDTPQSTSHDEQSHRRACCFWSTSLITIAAQPIQPAALHWNHYKVSIIDVFSSYVCKCDDYTGSEAGGVVVGWHSCEAAFSRSLYVKCLCSRVSPNV